MAINVYYASPDQTGRNHAGTQADPFSSDDLFGVRNDNYPSKLVRPCKVFLLPGNNAYGSPNYNPAVFTSNNGESSFYFGSDPPNNGGFIILEAVNRDTATNISQLPRIGQIKTSFADDPILISGVWFFGAEAVASGCRIFFDRCVFLHQTSFYSNALLTCLNQWGGHTIFNGCYFSIQASSFNSSAAYSQTLGGYYVFFGCWFDTYCPIERSQNSQFYEQCVFRNMDPAIDGKIAFYNVASSDIKRCLFWRYDQAIVESGWEMPGAPEYGEKARNIIQNCLFYECNSPIVFYFPNSPYQSSSLIWGNVYYGASSLYEAYLNAWADQQFLVNAGMAMRKYTGEGLPLGYGRPVMYMNTANPFPQNPTQEQIENSPDEVKAGVRLRPGYVYKSGTLNSCGNRGCRKNHQGAS